MLSNQEVERLRYCIETSEDIKNHAYGRNDGKGRQSRLCVWNYAGNDVTGVVARYSDTMFLLDNEISQKTTNRSKIFLIIFGDV